jgi:S1-C subfamily serine protease
MSEQEPSTEKSPDSSGESQHQDSAEDNASKEKEGDTSSDSDDAEGSSLEDIAPAGCATQDDCEQKGVYLATGTGFFVSPDGYLLTNQHVIDSAKNVAVFLNDEMHPARIIDESVEDDLALLKIDVESEFLEINIDLIAKGEEIVVLGYPNTGVLGNEQKATFGHINSHSGLQNDPRYYQVSAPIQPGNSGSPMLNDSAQVVGIVTATLNQVYSIITTGTLAQSVNYALKTEYAVPLLSLVAKLRVSSDRNESLRKAEVVKRAENAIALIVAYSDESFAEEMREKAGSPHESTYPEPIEISPGDVGGGTTGQGADSSAPNTGKASSDRSQDEQETVGGTKPGEDQPAGSKDSMQENGSVNERDSDLLPSQRKDRNAGFQGIYKESISEK